MGSSYPSRPRRGPLPSLQAAEVGNPFGGFLLPASPAQGRSRSGGRSPSPGFYTSWLMFIFYSLCNGEENDHNYLKSSFITIYCIYFNLIFHCLLYAGKKACVEAVCREVQKLYFLSLPSHLFAVVSSPFLDVLGALAPCCPWLCGVEPQLLGNPGSAAENVSA